MKKICSIFIIFSLFIFVSCGSFNKEDKNETPDSEERVTDRDIAGISTPDNEADDAEKPDSSDTELTEEPDKEGGDTEQTDDSETVANSDISVDDAVSWSSKKASKTWEEAVEYCDNLDEAGFTDWHLPTIEELRYLVQNCPSTATGGECIVSDEHHRETSELCQCEVDKEVSGKYSKINDYDKLWSSFEVPDSSLEFQDLDLSYAWYLDFVSAAIKTEFKTSRLYVRCARCREGYTWDSYFSRCLSDTQIQQKDCTGLPEENAEWNDVSQITQKWSGYTWLPSAEGIYSSENSDKECRFNCKADYQWSGSNCIQKCTVTGGTPCVDTDVPDLQSDSDSICMLPKYMWSSKKEQTTFEEALAYCENLQENGHDDWELPKIEVLRTLIPDTAPTNLFYGECKVQYLCTSYDECYDSTKCEADSNVWGTLSRIGDNTDDYKSHLWSASEVSDYQGTAWSLNFYTGGIYKSDETDQMKSARCVRIAPVK